MLTIHLNFFQVISGGYDWIEMPSATLGYRAAQRCAEFIGLDAESDEVEWQLATYPEGEFLPPGEVVAPYDGMTVILLSKPR